MDGRPRARRNRDRVDRGAACRSRARAPGQRAGAVRRVPRPPVAARLPRVVARVRRRGVRVRRLPSRGDLRYRAQRVARGPRAAAGTRARAALRALDGSARADPPPVRGVALRDGGVLAVVVVLRRRAGARDARDARARRARHAALVARPAGARGRCRGPGRLREPHGRGRVARDRAVVRVPARRRARGGRQRVVLAADRALDRASSRCPAPTPRRRAGGRSSWSRWAPCSRW